jgi:predicted nucleic acid-binding protein
MFVLDTDSISHDQKAHPILKEKVNNTPRNLLFSTSVTVEELLKGRLAYINRNRKSPVQLSLGHSYLMETISYLRKWDFLVTTKCGHCFCSLE